MQWKDVLIGALASLFVTVAGGIAVYYLTKEPEFDTKERLLYSVEESASFTGGAKDVSFITLKMQNAGGASAKNVNVIVTFPSANVQDVAVKSDAGATLLKKEIKSQTFTAIYQQILPNESVTFNLLLSANERPAISIRSDDAMAAEIDPGVDLYKNESPVAAFFKQAAAVTGLSGGLVILASFFFLKKKGLFAIRRSEKNNAAFVLLHSGSTDEAINILRGAIRQGAYDPYVFANLALCYAIKGDFDEANRLMRASEFVDAADHAKAVIHFNEALIATYAGDLAKAKLCFKQAISLSSREIRKYCKKSVHCGSRLDQETQNIVA